MLIARLMVLAVAWPVASLAAAPVSSGEGWPREVTDGRSAGVQLVDDRTCAGCHGRQHEAWSGSHHDRAMQPANAKTVLGDFDDASFTHFGVTSRFFESNGRFFVHTDGPDGRLADFEIDYAFGVEPLQQYLIALPGGHLQALSIAWDTQARRWVHLYPEERIEHDDPLHWTKRS